MSLSDYPKCGTAHCTCGHEYQSWTAECLVAHVTMLIQALKDKGLNFQLTPVPQAAAIHSGDDIADAVRSYLRKNCFSLSLISDESYGFVPATMFTLSPTGAQEELMEQLAGHLDLQFQHHLDLLEADGKVMPKITLAQAVEQELDGDLLLTANDFDRLCASDLSERLTMSQVPPMEAYRGQLDYMGVHTDTLRAYKRLAHSVLIDDAEIGLRLSKDKDWLTYEGKEDNGDLRFALRLKIDGLSSSSIYKIVVN